MYNTYWNLREKPFQNVPDPRFAYLSDQHHEGLARMIYLVDGNKLGGVLTGAYGVGKSMVLELLAQKIRADQKSRYLCVEILSGETIGMARQILAFIGQPQNVPDMTAVIEIIRANCHDPKAAFKHTVLAIDEAHLINDAKTYEFLHMLTNLSVLGRDLTPIHPAFTILLSGHPDLTLRLTPYESLRQRLQMVWRLEPLTQTQTLEYIQHRIRTAGGDIWIFEENAITEIFKVTIGLPRLINNICDVALMLGYAAHASKITPELIKQSAAETLPPPEKKE